MIRIQYDIQVEFVGNAARIKNTGHFDFDKILFCGQAFRWEKMPGFYRGIAHGRILNISCKDDIISFYPVTEADFRDIWMDYFDLKRDYEKLTREYADDAILAKGVEYAYGIRVLNQQPFETLVSFILSANNNIKRITGIIEKLCRAFGESISYDGETYYVFPKAEVLATASPEDIIACGTGYRGPYVQEAARAVCAGLDLEAVKKLPYAEAKKELMQIKGVGGKVADCVLLYALGFSEAFPMDVWIKRVIYNLYGFCGRNEMELRQYIEQKFGSHAGIAQQYLFHYVRENRLGKEACDESKV